MSFYAKSIDSSYLRNVRPVPAPMAIVLIVQKKSRRAVIPPRRRFSFFVLRSSLCA